MKGLNTPVKYWSVVWMNVRDNMRGMTYLLTLITLLTSQTVHHAAAGKVGDLHRAIRLSGDVRQYLYKIRVLDKFDTYLEVHLLMVRAITNASESIISEMKIRARQEDMRTIRTAKHCLGEAEKKVSKLSQQVYINEVGNCANDFVAKYEETASSAVDLSYKCAEESGRLYRAIEDCKLNDDEAACISREAHTAEEIFEELELSGESLVREITITVQMALKDLHSCFENITTPSLQSGLSTIKREFLACIGTSKRSTTL